MCILNHMVNYMRCKALRTFLSNFLFLVYKCVFKIFWNTFIWEENNML
jgi:hypothetical protein